MLQLATTFGDSKFECTYLAPDNQSVVEYNGSMLVHSSLLLPLTMRLWIINTTNIPGHANQSGLRGTYYVPSLFENPCLVFNASCDPTVDSYWNTNFSLQEPNSTNVPGSGGYRVDVISNYMPCVNSSSQPSANNAFRLKGVLHMLSMGALKDEFCIGQCCGPEYDDVVSPVTVT
jgi:hypothetical protein